MASTPFFQHVLDGIDGGSECVLNASLLCGRQLAGLVAPDRALRGQSREDIGSNASQPSLGIGVMIGLGYTSLIDGGKR